MAYRRITDELQDRGFSINHKKVARIMNKYGIKSKLHQNKKTKTINTTKKILSQTYYKKILIKEDGSLM